MFLYDEGTGKWYLCRLRVFFRGSWGDFNLYQHKGAVSGPLELRGTRIFTETNELPIFYLFGLMIHD